MKRKVQTEYALAQSLYWAFNGSMLSFSSAFLLPNGFSNTEIGLILSIANLLATAVQPFLADYADHASKHPLSLILSILEAILILLTGSLFLLHGKTVGLFLFYAITLAWYHMILPLLNELSFKFQKFNISISYAFSRGMGSLGYSIMCGILGVAVESYGIVMIPSLSILVAAGLFLATLLLHRNYHSLNHEADTERSTSKPSDISLGEFIRSHKPLLLLNIGAALAFLCAGIFGAYMLQIVQSIGGSSKELGTALVVTALCEIPAMSLYDTLAKRYGNETMIKVSMFGFILKAVIFVLARSYFLILIGCAVQFFGFAFFMPAMVGYTHDHMSEGEAVKGQALFTISCTISGLLANLSGGLILDHFGVNAMLYYTLLCGVLGTIIVFRALKLSESNK
ncbi:MAG: MFS transporter [Solobacterium sp.]|nr:MFS transporter [Solobacterium sp.]